MPSKSERGQAPQEDLGLCGQEIREENGIRDNC